jgi:predicted aspartyl protease
MNNSEKNNSGKISGEDATNEIVHTNGMSYDNLWVGPELSTARLQIPSYAQLQIQDVELFDNEKLQFVEVEINGSFRRLLLDTGACTTTLVTSDVATLGAEIQDTEKVVIGFYGYEEKLRVAEVEFRMGDILQKRQVNLVQQMPTAELFDDLGIAPLHGIIGNDLLRELKAKIDYFTGFLWLTL